VRSAAAHPAKRAARGQAAAREAPEGSQPGMEAVQETSLADLGAGVLEVVLSLCDTAERCRLSGTCRRLRACALPRAPAAELAACGEPGCTCEHDGPRAAADGKTRCERKPQALLGGGVCLAVCVPPPLPRTPESSGGCRVRC
jgi:hypothetical protein